MASKIAKSGRFERPSSIRNPMLPSERKEESMESVDVSLEKRMSRPQLDGPARLGLRSTSAPESGSDPSSVTTGRAVRSHSTTDQLPATAENDHYPKRDNPSELELDLDKFMASLTARESPDVVIQTIASTKAAHSTVSMRLST
ncbi:hypothetical protein A1O7_03104 [Cladophialophora yegresii CBS 114405]|uniref:Uncharacterized protein n=1 Tax=Cladophialophora yegresii CBS 114405 TaxID=1182544 RepID=W9WDM7_9EURO|nr:uncharacterized protein A1O7_03104 [Cladophialophora yegresii CBS 114405]EXJ62666.1 hypothetical protein A1O7_03104 [Cladophialophora yegresii CBS 114405]